MVIDSEEKLIESCKNLIEAELAWRRSEDWTNQDFEELSEKIFDKTTITLSATTLKRIWGKVKYDSAPTQTTLNTLAQFIDFEHWRAFRQDQFSKNGKSFLTENGYGSKEMNRTRGKKTPKKSSIKTYWILGSFVLISIMIAFFFVNSKRKTTDLVLSDYKFDSKKILSSGLPNSVIFDYDASAAPFDSVFIQQSWDSTLRKQIPKKHKQHTSIYYYPGFFKAKLLIGKQIVKEHDLFIPTGDWLPMIEQKPVPIYFKKEEAIINGQLSLPISKIKSQNIDLQPVAPYVKYSNVRDFGDLTTDNFIFETSLKNDYREGSSICQNSEIILLWEGSAINIPFSAKGCISENNLYFLGKRISGKEHDLSGFGVDFSDFVHFRCEVLAGRAKFFINNHLVYQLDNTDQKEQQSLKIVGIVYRFKGTGSVESVKLSKVDG